MNLRESRGGERMGVPSEFLFWYKARVVNVVDGDTLDLETDLGFRIGFLSTQRSREHPMGSAGPESTSWPPVVRAPVELGTRLPRNRNAERRTRNAGRGRSR